MRPIVGARYWGFAGDVPVEWTTSGSGPAVAFGLRLWQSPIWARWVDMETWILGGAQL